MNKNFVYIITFVLLTACSHANKERIFKSDLQIEELTSNKIKITETINPTDMVILDDFFVISNEYQAGVSCFFVFSLKDKKFCYSFGQLGQGPDDFIAPRFMQRNQGNTLSIYDSAFGKISKFDITGQSAEKITEQKITNIKIPFQNISCVSDSILLFTIQLKDSFYMCSYNMEQKSVVDTLLFETNIKNQMGGKYNSTFDFFCFSNYKEKFVVTFNCINQVVVGELSGNGHFLRTDFQKPNIDLSEKLIDNIIYYMFPVSTQHYFYTQYYGKRFKYMQPFPFNIEGRDMDFLIEVYDWQKKPIRLLHLDSDILRFIIDEKTDKLYAWDPSKDFDYLLEYDLNKKTIAGDHAENEQ